VADQVLVNGIPLLQDRAVDIGRNRADDDVKAFSQEGQIDHRIASDEIRSEDPGRSGGRPLRRNHGHRPLDTVESEFVAVVRLRKPRTAAGDVRPFFWKVAVRVLDAIE